jgi:hypothetical protein
MPTIRPLALWIWGVTLLITFGAYLTGIPGEMAAGPLCFGAVLGWSLRKPPITKE